FRRELDPMAHLRRTGGQRPEPPVLLVGARLRGPAVDLPPRRQERAPDAEELVMSEEVLLREAERREPDDAQPADDAVHHAPPFSAGSSSSGMTLTRPMPRQNEHGVGGVCSLVPSPCQTDRPSR